MGVRSSKRGAGLLTVAIVPVEIDGVMWNLVINQESQHIVTSPSGKDVVAYTATVVGVIE